MRKATNLIARVSRDVRGNVLPIAAAGVMVGLVIIGSAVDLSRNYLARQQLQSACDAGVLAGRRTVTTKKWDAPSATAATTYFNNNFAQSTLGTRSTTFTPTSPDGGITVTATATTILDTVIMQIFGYKQFDIAVNCASSMGVGNADIMMVLDTTGSMDFTLSGGQKRISALQDAMRNFYTTMASATANSNARIRYGFVPFSSTVNVGRLLTALDSRYIVDNYNYQSRSFDNKTLKMTYRQINFDTSKFKTFASTNVKTGELGTNQSFTWNGCIQERGTVAQSTFTYSSTTKKISPAGALDLDLDSAPDLNNDATKWAPLWSQITYLRYARNFWGNTYYTTDTTNEGSQAAEYCPVAARQLATMSQSDFNTYVNSLDPVGGTYLDIGMIWGGRMLSPQGMWKNVVNDDPKNGGEVAKHIIFMTDGEMEPNAYIAQAWGLEWWDRRVTTDGSTNDEARHTQRFLATCEAIKDKSIRVWVVAFTSGLSDDLKKCASTNSSFVATNATELNAAFQEIAKQVGELRITQ